MPANCQSGRNCNTPPLRISCSTLERKLIEIPARATVAMRYAQHLRRMEAYDPTKLAITWWRQACGNVHPDGLVSMSVNPALLLATRMVHEGFGISGNHLKDRHGYPDPRRFCRLICLWF